MRLALVVMTVSAVFVGLLLTTRPGLQMKKYETGVLSEYDQPTISHGGTLVACLVEVRLPKKDDPIFRSRVLDLRLERMRKVEARIASCGIPHQVRFLSAVNMLVYFTPDPDELEDLLNLVPEVQFTVFEKYNAR